MTKFHINKHGVPAPCKAKKGNCPLGGDSGTENHFDNEADAQRFADEMFKNKYGVVNFQSAEKASFSEKGEAKLKEIYHYLDNEAVKDLGDYDIGDDSYIEMEEQLDKYYQAIMDKYDGEEVDLEKVKDDLSYNWVEEAERADYSHYDFDPDQSMFSSGSDYSDEAKAEAIDNAVDVGMAFYERADILDEAYKKVDKFDWGANGDDKRAALDKALYYAVQSSAE